MGEPEACHRSFTRRSMRRVRPTGAPAAQLRYQRLKTKAMPLDWMGLSHPMLPQAGE